MNNFTIVSWYTEGIYEEVINKYFLNSVKKLDIKYKIYKKSSRGNWKHNTRLKPEVAFEALNEFDTDILLVDADAVFNSYPTLINNIPDLFDIGIYKLDKNSFFNRDFGINRYEYLSGTLFFKNRNISRQLIGKWLDYCIGATEPDQILLQLSIEAMKSDGLNIYELPHEYCWIHDLPNGKEPYIKRPDNVIIEHYQASRQTRNKI